MYFLLTQGCTSDRGQDSVVYRSLRNQIVFRLIEQDTAGDIILNPAEWRSDTRKHAGVDVVLL